MASMSLYERTVRDLVAWILTVSPDEAKLERMKVRVGKSAVNEALVRTGRKV